MNDQLIDTFLAEAHELVVDLEKALLLLESNLHDKEGISSIFRSMHTLKGAAGMFGYDSISTITHHLESIYQEIRDGNREMNAFILATTFKTLDQLRILLQSPPQSKTSNDYHELLEVIEALETDGQQLENNPTTHEQKNALTTYYVNFLPAANIMRNGTNPLYLVDDLLVLGNGLSLPFFHQFPDFNSFNPTESFMGFEVLLCTDKSEEEIKSVFLFVEDSCEVIIKKITEGNILREISSTENPWTGRTALTVIGYEAICEILIKKDKRDLTAVEAKRTIQSKSTNIRVDSTQLDDLMNLVSELVTTQARLALYSNHSASVELSAISENVEKITRRLRDNAFTMSLVPIENIVVRFQRLVSDLSKELNKEIEFKAEGTETKIDKSIIEKLTDPILHLLRNCIDHGIENPEERIQAGKPSKGTVKIKSYYSGASVMIEISDDGAGLKLDRIRDKAVQQGIIDADSELSDKELAELIFIPGFSTASAVTGVSGRGVGMDVVKKNITDIRGEIEISTVKGQGTTFSIKLPLTLSILDGLLVKIGTTDFVLPLSSVAKCYEIETSKLETTFNHWVTLDGKRTPFVFLREDFGIEEGKPALSQIIHVPYNNSHVGLVVDKIEGEYQAVLKPLGRFYQDQHEFSGATILGDGSVALVLDPNRLITKLSKETQTQEIYNQ